MPRLSDAELDAACAAVGTLAAELRVAWAERDALLDAGETLARAVGIGLTVTDCNEACDHPACHILRARNRWRRVAVESLARQPGESTTPG